MHHMDTDEASREKAKRELHKNATSYIVQILEALSHKKSSCTDTCLPSQKRIPIRWTRYSPGEVKTNSLTMFSSGLLHTDVQVLD